MTGKLKREIMRAVMALSFKRVKAEPDRFARPAPSRCKTGRPPRDPRDW